MSKPLPSVLLLKAFFLAVGFWLASLPSLQAQSPPTGNLQLWLKADAGASTNGTNGVTVWADQSGNARHAVLPGGAAAPIFIASDAGLGGKPSVQFNPSQFMQLTNTLDIVGDLSSFAVVKLHSQALNYRGIWDQAPLIGVTYPDPNQWMIYNDGRNYLQRGNGSANYGSFWSSTVVPLTNYVALGFITAGSAVDFFKNNRADGSATISPAVTIAGGGVPIRIGARYPSGSSLNGEVAELLIYDAALSGDDRTNLWIYLENKYGLDHPVNVNLTTSPANGSTIIAPTTVIATAAISTIGVLIARVDFLVNDVNVASVSSPPYSVPLNVLSPGTLTVKAIALDSLGLNTVSTPSVLTVTGTTPTFTANTNLVLWLKADAGVTTNGSGQVTGWADQTTNANNAVQGVFGNAPTLVNNAINGKPAIHLNGANFEYFDVAHSSSLSITGDISAVMVMNVPASFQGYGMLFYKGGNNGYPSPNALMLSPGGLPTMNRGTGAGMTQDLLIGTQSVPGGQYAIVFYNQAGTSMKQFLNAMPNGTQTATITPVDTESGPLHIGTRGDLYSYLTADITEIMMFNSAVSGTNLDNLHSYLGTKYGLALVVRGPNSPPTVAITSPANASSAVVPANLTVNATASDADGAVTSVELFANGFSFGALSGAPYQWFLRVKTPGSVVFTAVAIDNLGAKSTNTVTITTTGNPLPGYEAGTNLALWLKADAGVTTNGSGGVTDWADQSGKGNNASAPSAANTPTFINNAVNGRPALHFDLGLTSYLTVPHSSSLSITGDIASFVVMNPSANNASNYRMIWFQGNSYPSPNAFMMFPGNQPTPCRGDEANLIQDLYNAPLVPTPLQYSILGFSMAGNTMKQYLDGVDNGYPQTAGAGGLTAPVDGGGPLFIGTRGDFYSYLRSDLAELMIFNSAVAGADLDKVREYLGIKYGIVIIEIVSGRPSLSVERLGNGTVRISWPVTFSGYVLESASSLPAVSWSTVPGVVNNQVTVTPVGQKFYRLRLP